MSATARLFLGCSVVLTFTASAAGQGCTTSFNASGSPDPHTEVTRSLKLWQGVTLIVCFGIFGVFVAFTHRLIRTFVFYDDYLVDTYFDAGGEANFAMVACCVVAKRLWVASYTFSTADVRAFGIVGHFWYSASGVIHLLLFAILASEIRIKAPGARTFLQVIRSRFGQAAHVIVMIFAFVTNIIVAGLVMSEGTRILTWLCQDIDQYVVLAILTCAVGIYTFVGGLGGAMYMAYFCVACIVAICLVYFSDSAFNSLDRPDYRYTEFFRETHTAALCAEPTSGSLLTFLSRGGLLEGVVFALAGFSSVFVNQGFWLTAISARAPHSVWGYLTGAFVWFSIPFLLSFVLGMGYWKLSVDLGMPLVSDKQAEFGAIPVVVSQQLLGRFGDFMMYSLTLAVVLGAVSSEILSISSIVVYDIYQTYVTSFDFNQVDTDVSSPCIDEGQGVGEEAYLRYNRKCVVVQFASVAMVAALVYPIALVVMVIGMEPQWLFNFLGVVVGSAVIPVVLAVVWHRTTGSGVVVGVVAGFLCGFTAWLVYASRFDRGLTRFEANTGRPEVFIVGLATSLGVGGVACVLVSLTCGGCDPHRDEVDEWEKCRGRTTRYVVQPPSWAATGRLVRPTTLDALRCAELSAYVVGVLLSVAAVFVWPAVMLTAGVFSVDVFRRWGLAVFVWAVVAAFFACVVTLLYEIVDKCCVSYNMRLSRHHHHQQRDQPTIGVVLPVTDQFGAVPRGQCGTCRKSGSLARQTYRMADMTVTGANVYPTMLRTQLVTADYGAYPTPGIVGTYRGGTLVTKRW